MNFTQTQNYEILENIIKHGSGIEEILRMSLEILMKAERHEHNFSNGDLSNGYRFRKTYGQGKLLELKVPRTRNGNFYPMILGLLRDQEEEARQIAFKLYGAGLTTEQVGDLFGEIYGKSYSSSQVSQRRTYGHRDSCSESFQNGRCSAMYGSFAEGIPEKGKSKTQGRSC